MISFSPLCLGYSFFIADRRSTRHTLSITQSPGSLIASSSSQVGLYPLVIREVPLTLCAYSTPAGLVYIGWSGLPSPTDSCTIPRIPRCVKPQNPVEPCRALSLAISVTYGYAYWWLDSCVVLSLCWCVVCI